MNREQEAKRMHPFDARASGVCTFCDVGLFENELVRESLRRSIVVSKKTRSVRKRLFIGSGDRDVYHMRSSQYVFAFVCVVVFGISHQRSVVQDS